MTFHRASGWRVMKLMARGNWPLETRPAGSKGGAHVTRSGVRGNRGASGIAGEQGGLALETRPEGIVSVRRRGVECKCRGKGSG